MKTYLPWVFPIILILISGCSMTFDGMDNQQLILLLDNKSQSRQFAIMDELLKRQLSDTQYQDLAGKMPEILEVPSQVLVKQKALELALQKYPDKAETWLCNALLNERLDVNVQKMYVDTLAEMHSVDSLGALIYCGYPGRLHFQYQGDFVPPIQADYSHAIEKISGRPLDTFLLDVVGGGEMSETSGQKMNLQSNKVRLCALYWLVQRQGRGMVATRLKKQSGNIDKELMVLWYWLDHFDYLPSNFSQYCNMAQMLDELAQEDLVKLKSIYNDLKLKGYMFEICDSWFILNFKDQILASDRNMLINSINVKLQNIGHSKRRPTHRGASDDYLENFESQIDSLSLVDLERIRMLIGWLEKRDNREILANILKEDLYNENTELGGLCMIEDGQLKFKVYMSGNAISDHAYVENDKLWDDAVKCFSRWHCHAGASQDNLPGPGIDDMRYVTYVKTPNLIITLLNDMNGLEFNIDYINPSGKVIDIGVYGSK
ncbi:MAG: hypothetical protein JEZ07_02545 [Phycisphaerae bacterium]|nr:hypothetical protein [Phycisphaerae bacterium]